MKTKYGKANSRSGTRVDLKFKNQNRPRNNLYAIYPDYWKEKWGEPPCLGHVYADNEFNAVRRAAVTRGVYHKNITFNALAVRVKNKSIRLNRNQLRTVKGFVS